MCCLVTKSQSSHSANPWSVAHRLLCLWGFHSQENRVELPLPSPEFFPTQKSRSWVSYISKWILRHEPTREAQICIHELDLSSSLCFTPISSPPSFVHYKGLGKGMYHILFLILMSIYHKTGNSLFYKFHNG